MPIQMPMRKQNQVGGILSAAGQAIGNAYGGPTGGAVGGQLGGMVGGGQKEQPQSVGSNAMDRRMQQTPEPLPIEQVNQAEQALASMPPEYQKTYGATLRRARAMDSGGVA